MECIIRSRFHINGGVAPLHVPVAQLISPVPLTQLQNVRDDVVSPVRPWPVASASAAAFILLSEASLC